MGELVNLGSINPGSYNDFLAAEGSDHIDVTQVGEYTRRLMVFQESEEVKEAKLRDLAARDLALPVLSGEVSVELQPGQAGLA
jgi:hypothetical protein